MPRWLAIIQHISEFKQLESVDYGIATAQKTNRGKATTQAILSYVGKPFEILIDGRPSTIPGTRVNRYDSLGLNCLQILNLVLNRYILPHSDFD